VDPDDRVIMESQCIAKQHWQKKLNLPVYFKFKVFIIYLMYVFWVSGYFGEELYCMSQFLGNIALFFVHSKEICQQISLLQCTYICRP